MGARALTSGRRTGVYLTCFRSSGGPRQSYYLSAVCVYTLSPSCAAKKAPTGGLVHGAVVLSWPRSLDNNTLTAGARPEAPALFRLHARSIGRAGQKLEH